jgi:hypothetical protein
MDSSGAQKAPTYIPPAMPQGIPVGLNEGPGGGAFWRVGDPTTPGPLPVTGEGEIGRDVYPDEPPTVDFGERQVVTEEDDPDITVLTEEERRDFANLMTCGRKVKLIEVMGHSVVIETLNCDDDLKVGTFTKDYIGTDAYERAWQVGVVAAGVRYVDGRPPVPPALSPDEEKAQYLLKCQHFVKHYPVTLTQIYQAITALSPEFYEWAKKLGKLPG